jgi:hypothetical protein
MEGKVNEKMLKLHYITGLVFPNNCFTESAERRVVYPEFPLGDEGERDCIQ